MTKITAALMKDALATPSSLQQQQQLSQPHSQTTSSAGTASAEAIAAGAQKLAEELSEFLQKHPDLPSAANTVITLNAINPKTKLDKKNEKGGLKSAAAVADLQLTACRQLRQFMPHSKALLQTAQERHWIPLLISWLNLHDRPAVQVESLLALTHIAELCAAQQQQAQQQVAAAAAAGSLPTSLQAAAQSASYIQAAAAAAAASGTAAGSVPGGTAGGSNAAAWTEAMEAAKYKYAAAAAAQLAPNASNSATAAAAAAAAAAATKAAALYGATTAAAASSPPGSVPFPPLSFSQTLSPEAVSALDASLTQTLHPEAVLAALTNSTTTTASDNSSGNASKKKKAIANNDSMTSSSTAITTTTTNAAATVNLSPSLWGLSGSNNTANGSSSSNSNITAPLFPGAPGSATTTAMTTAGGVGAVGGINFSSLAPPPGGPHCSVSTPTAAAASAQLFHATAGLGSGGSSKGPGPFLPPPTPVVGEVFAAGSSSSGGGGSIQNSIAPSFPQQLSASSQHLLLRHADAIPTLISLLNSPNREVYEQAMWILGSISAGDAPSTTAAAAAAASGGGHSNSNSRGSDGSNSNSNANSSSSSAAAAAALNPEKTVSARDVILAAGVMDPLLRCLERHPQHLSLQRIGSWTLSNLVDGIFQQSSSSSSSSSGNDKDSKSGDISKSSKSKQDADASGTSSTSASRDKSKSASSSASSTSDTKDAKALTGTSGSSDYSSADQIDMAKLSPVLRRLLKSSDSEVLSYTCWTLSHLCDGPSSHIAAVVTTPPSLIEKGHPKGGLVPRLVELLMHLSWRVTKPALRTIGNIVCAECGEDAAAALSAASGGSTDYTEVILEYDAVPRLKDLVTHSNREIQKEACWTLSNIAAGTTDQIQAVIDSGAIAPLVKLVRDKKTDQEVRSEACWVVLNATSCGSDSQIEVLVDEGCVSVLGVLLSEASMVMMALEGLERVLQVEETRELLRRERMEADFLRQAMAGKTPVEKDSKSDDKASNRPLVSAALIEKAREGHHHSTAVTKRADRIWKQHFVSCALCKKSYSKHTVDASFCEECKCYVCINCNCRIYHLDYQEELWAATEEATAAKKNAKKSKNKKKKERLKQKKAKQVEQDEQDAAAVAAAAAASKTKNKDSNKTKSPQTSESGAIGAKTSTPASGNTTTAAASTTSKSLDDDDDDDDEEEDFDDEADPAAGDNTNSSSSAQNQIDFVLYLQQTGSILALAKLMDALEGATGEDYDEELDDYERKMIREQQALLGKSSTAH